METFYCGYSSGIERDPSKIDAVGLNPTIRSKINNMNKELLNTCYANFKYKEYIKN